MKFEILKNKRLQFVLAITWLIASFLIVRTSVMKATDSVLQLSLSNCYKFEGKQECIDNAFKIYSKINQITLLQLLDMFVLFIVPIIFIIVLTNLIKWINNYNKNT